MSSTPKKDIVDAQSTSGSQDQTSNVPWDAKMKVTYKNINLAFFKYEKNEKRAIDEKCKAFSLEKEYPQKYSISEKHFDELNFVENFVTKHSIILLSIKYSENIKALKLNLGSLKSKLNESQKNYY
jgi:hypothetical protein